jgi:Protein of unknown function, DUF417
MNRFVDRRLNARDGDGVGRVPGPGLLNPLVNILVRCGLLKEDLDYHVLRGAMVVVFFFFGYQKWWAYEAQRLIPYISHGPLIFWLYPAFGVRGASWFLGSCEWSFGTLLLLGFWNKKLGILGALGSCMTFVGTVTIIPFMLGRLGRRVSGHDRQRSVPDEGRRAAGRILLSAEAGRAESREVISNQPTMILRRFDKDNEQLARDGAWRPPRRVFGERMMTGKSK